MRVDSLRRRLTVFNKTFARPTRPTSHTPESGPPASPSQLAGGGMKVSISAEQSGVGGGSELSCVGSSDEMVASQSDEACDK